MLLKKAVEELSVPLAINVEHLVDGEYEIVITDGWTQLDMEVTRIEFDHTMKRIRFHGGDEV